MARSHPTSVACVQRTLILDTNGKIELEVDFGDRYGKESSESGKSSESSESSVSIESRESGETVRTARTRRTVRTVERVWRVEQVGCGLLFFEYYLGDRVVGGV